MMWPCLFSQCERTLQGRTLEAIALELDLRYPGLAYTALSRVRDELKIYWSAVPALRDFVPKPF